MTRDFFRFTGSEGSCTCSSGGVRRKGEDAREVHALDSRIEFVAEDDREGDIELKTDSVPRDGAL